MKTTEKYQEYLSGNYVPPKLISKKICNVAKKSEKTKRELHQKFLKRAPSNQDHVYLAMRKEAFMNRYKLYLVQNENKRLHTKLEQKNHKRGILLARNVNKRIKRRDTIITSLQEETVKLQNKLAQTQTKAKEIKPTKKSLERRYTDMTSLEAVPSSGVYPTKVHLHTNNSCHIRGCSIIWSLPYKGTFTYK